MKYRFLLVVAGLAAVVAVPATAGAQERSRPKCADDSGDGTNYEIVRGPDGKKIFRIKTGFCIEGKVPKPSVIYVLNASTINYEWDNLKRDFLQKSLEAVEQKPF